MMNGIHRVKIKATALAVLTGLLVLFVSMPLPDAAARAENVLRLHILADSDSPEDQRVKLLVRDAVVRALPAGESAAQTEAYLLCHGAELLTLVENTLAENGSTDRAQLMLGTYPFPDRAYRETLYPAGEYNALRIIIGSGAGQNWWCVLFPPLCIITEEQEPLPEKEDIEFESSIGKWIRSWRDAS